MTKLKRALIISVSLSLANQLLLACSKEKPKVTMENGTEFRKVALDFAKSLAAREYDKAYAMTSQGFRGRMTVDQMRAAFEAIVPSDWGPIGPIEVGSTMTTWPAKQTDDLGWAYVSIGGDIYSEGLIVVVTSENGRPKIRGVEFGRP